MNEVSSKLFAQVYQEESESIQSSRQSRGEKELDAPLVGLAIDGGGIRGIIPALVS